MNPWWLYAIPAALAAITIAGILATVLVGRQTEERPGFIDLSGSRARAEARRSALKRPFPASPAIRTFESRGEHYQELTGVEFARRSATQQPREGDTA